MPVVFGYHQVEVDQFQAPAPPSIGLLHDRVGTRDWGHCHRIDLHIHIVCISILCISRKHEHWLSRLYFLKCIMFLNTINVESMLEILCILGNRGRQKNVNGRIHPMGELVVGKCCTSLLCYLVNRSAVGVMANDTLWLHQESLHLVKRL